ncbi:MAG: chorismate-binding protein [Vulcanimicrobiaceae bacterium]
MSLRVIAGISPALLFEDPIETLRSATFDETMAVLSRADAALAAGHYVAGYVTYEWRAVLGVFCEPRTIVLNGAREAFALGPLAPRIGMDAYRDALNEIARAIRDGDVYQVNYTVPFDASFRGDPLAAYAHLASTNETAYNVYVEDGDVAILSLSPELFLRFAGDRIETKPMKGTAALDRVDELDDPKNHAEHVMIVDLLRNDLHRICDDVRVEQLFEIERYPTFATMTSTIAGTLRAQTSLPEIFRAAFPCGSITGAPKRAAIQQIARLEPFPRDVYTGTAGYLGPRRNGWWNVAIRTLSVERARGRARYNTGGGIVADSRTPDEWDELLLKTLALRSAIEPFAFWESLRGGPAPGNIAAHLDRLAATAEYFAIPFDRGQALRTIAAAVATPYPSFVRLRLSLGGALAVTHEPLPPTPEPVRICLAEARVRSNDFMLGYKSSWRPAHDAAAREAAKAGCFDAILRNERGELTEGSRTTIFVQMGNMLYTPPLSCGLLPGILRQELVNAGRAVERVLFAEDLATADAIYVGNSVRGLLQIDLVGEPISA